MMSPFLYNAFMNGMVRAVITMGAWERASAAECELWLV